MGQSATMRITGSGTITVDGTGGNGGSGKNFCTGITIAGSPLVTIGGSGSLTLTGTGGTGTSGSNHGIEFRFDAGTDGQISSTGSGTITLNGTAGSATSYGINLLEADTLISSAASTGSFVLTGLPGTSSGSGPLYGINVQVTNAINFNSSSSTSLSMTGTGGPGSSGNNHGVRLAASISTLGAVTINGTGGSGGSNNYGCFLGASLTTSGGAITFGSATSTSVFLNTSISLDSTNAGSTAAGANIALTSGSFQGAQALTIRAGSGGAITLGGDIGTSGTRLTGLTFTSGASLTLGGDIFLTGVTPTIPMTSTSTGTSSIDTD